MYISGKIDLICVMGPTASGKTRYAVNLARQINGLLAERAATGVENLPKGAEIISADSRQIYIGMDIGTGKDMGEYGEIPVHLVDIVPAGERYNICRYQRDFSAVYEDCLKRAVVPILCGGSGLYIEAVTKAEYTLEDNSGLNLHLPEKTFYMATTIDRQTRRDRIDRRLDERFAEGMTDEIKRLIDGGVDPEALIRYGLEYKFITLHLLGQFDFQTMHDLLQNAIHQFAKRQMTWLRGMEKDGIRIHWVRP